MAEAIVMPKLGNTVESAIILAWHVVRRRCHRGR